MKKILILALSVILCLSVFSQSEVIWTVPQFPTIDDEVTVFFDASKGNAELANYEGDIYAHTGVITPESSHEGDWKHVVGNWGTADDRVLMTKIDDNSYTITFNITEFYGLLPGEEVLQLAFVFRSLDGSLAGRELDGGDIFTPVFSNDENLFVSRLSPKDYEILLEGDSLLIDIAVNQEIGVKIYDNNDLILETVTNNVTYKYLPMGKGDHELRYEFRSEEDSLFNASAFYVIDSTQSSEDPELALSNGVSVIDDVVYFQLHAPNKKFCFLLTELSDHEIDESFRMNQTVDGENFWIAIDRAQFSSQYISYQYFVEGDIAVADPYSELVFDPYNDWEIDPTGFEEILDDLPLPEEMPSGLFSIFNLDKEDYPWVVENFEGVENENLIIYETLIRDFLEDHSYSSLEDTLTYLKRLGVNAIQLMPISEFEGNRSWGYNPSFHMALDKYYGSPEQFKSFIDAAHQMDIAVIIDVVYNHVFSQSPLAQLYWDPINFRPSPDNPWLNVVAKHPFNVGYDVNHEYEGTKEWVKQTLSYWMDEYKIDGFRFDLSKGFTQKNSGSNSALMAQYDQGRIDILTDYANHIWSKNENAYVIMEHFADNVEERELSSLGMMMWGNESHQWAEAAMGYNSRLRSSDYSWRNFDGPNLIAYMESHDEERMAYKLLNFGNQNGSYDTRSAPILFRRIEAATTMYFSIPGPKMLWKFGELAYDYSINRCEDGSISEDCRLADKPITWDYLNNSDRQRLFDVNMAMAYLKDDLNLFSSDDFNLNDGDNFIKSIVINNEDISVVTVVNFNVEQEEVMLAFPFEGEWFEYFSETSVNVGLDGLIFKMKPGEYRVFTSKEVKLPIDAIHGELDIESQEMNFGLSPNPVMLGDQIEISGLPTPSVLDIYDVNGRLVFSDTFSIGVYQLPVNLNPGLYLIQSREEGLFDAKRLMVIDRN